MPDKFYPGTNIPIGTITPRTGDPAERPLVSYPPAPTNGPTLPDFFGLDHKRRIEALEGQIAELREWVEAIQAREAPVAMQWTRETPTEPGWYWFSSPGGNPIAIVVYSVNDDPPGLDFRYGMDKLSAEERRGGYWLPVVTPPDPPSLDIERE